VTFVGLSWDILSSLFNYYLLRRWILNWWKGYLTFNRGFTNTVSFTCYETYCLSQFRVRCETQLNFVLQFKQLTIEFATHVFSTWLPSLVTLYKYLQYLDSGSCKSFLNKYIKNTYFACCLEIKQRWISGIVSIPWVAVHGFDPRQHTMIGHASLYPLTSLKTWNELHLK